MFFGLAIITIGAVFLLHGLGIISGDTWNIIWPCLLIAIGLSMIFNDINKEKRCKSFGDRVERIFRDRE
ncbi:MAG: DUF5668 domain-containing protein [Candidatus Pacebacteria bacterium]|nr:DUF5668 domain-containing protein [Candidatus Paceibacterota bacterium]